MTVDPLLTPAMVIETLSKFRCHNLCVLLLVQHALGITAEFWKDTATYTGCGPTA